ncbi:MAG: cysteine desulfurase [Erysipelotrichaceae bacterium]|nr:cysteine desulfurase [Erysipelotrichaceae bacterium]
MTRSWRTQKVLPKIYLDHVSTTRPDPEVLETYFHLLRTQYSNSDALYDDGVTLYRLQEQSRARIAELLGVKAEEILFTSGASEANNMALKGVAWKKRSGHIISSYYEHSSVYEALKQLQSHGFEVTLLKPGADGRIDPQKVAEALREDTILVSIMQVNNELGSINDISAIKKIVKKQSHAYFHCDITQALGKTDVDLEDIDLASFSAHKIHGLKGSGVLVRKRHVEMEALISGGQQEFSLRGGTSNAPVNIVLAKTLRKALEKQPAAAKRISTLHAYLMERLKSLDGVRINSPADGLANLVNISTPVKSEVMLNCLNLKGIMVSSKSTCGSRKSEVSRSLEAMGIDDEYALRISLDAENTEAELDQLIGALKESIEKYG